MNFTRENKDLQFAIPLINSTFLEISNSQIYDSLNPVEDDSWKLWLTDDFLNEIRKDFLRTSDHTVIVLMVLYCLTFVTGIIGNPLVIFVFWRNPRMRTVTNLFLVNLAVCDLMVVCICMPFSLAMDVYTTWIYGAVWCKMVNFTQGLSVSSSILTLAVISMERFMAISKPLRARAFLSKQRSRKIMIVLWIVSSIIVLPELIVKNDVVVERILVVEIRSCVEAWPSKQLQHAYIFGLLILLYLIPLGLIFVGYCRISARLWRRDDNLHAACASGTRNYPKQAAKALEKRRKVARMLVILATIFALSWMPKHILSLVMDFSDKETIQRDGLLLRKLYSFGLWFALGNSSLNPICYCIMSESFKNAYKRAFRCCFSSKTLVRSSSFSLTGSTCTALQNQRGIMKPPPHAIKVHLKPIKADGILSNENGISYTLDKIDAMEVSCIGNSLYENGKTN